MPRKLTTEEFIKKARKVHGNEYDYSKTEYIDYLTKVCIICPKHGEFWQTPEKHLKGRGCRKCFDEKLGETHRFTFDDFIKNARKIHGDKYDYSKVDYVNSSTKVCIICPEHGEFWQTPLTHVNSGCGCKECRKETLHEKFKFDKETFIERAKRVHGDKYDYSNVVYVNSHTPVSIICSEHGEFSQKPYAHLNGHGCPICRESKLEKEVYDFLLDRKVNFEREKSFEWLRFEGKMFLDFYLPEHKIVIECQGEQHFIPVNWCADEKSRQQKFLLTKERDIRKKELCEKMGLKVFYFFHNHYFLDKRIYNEENIIKNLNDLRL